jgi:aminoglycoside/choline kinase family phosphotransferase
MAAKPLQMIPPDAAPSFLAQCGWDGCQILPLAGDASFRRYFRVVGEGRSAVLMDAPPPHEDPRPFIAIARHLHGLGFAAPGIIADDQAQGLVLIEDFGDARMAEAIIAEPAREVAIYEAAVDLLLALAKFPAAEGLRPYDMAEYQREAGLFIEWYAPALSLDVDAEGYRAAWAEALEPIAGHQTVTVLRDYHAENIMLLDDGKRLGLLDFQDALAGHPAYDLVSLLQDARRDVPPALEQAMIARYAAAVPFDDAAYALLGAQRNAKILGIFTRLWKRDGKPRYLGYQPRVWGYLERDLKHPALAPVTAWFDRNVPIEMRGAAWETLPA